MDLTFTIRERRADGRPNHRFHKVRYTAALRLGVVPDDAGGRIDVRFEGDVSTDVGPHLGKMAFKGTLILSGRRFTDVVVIVKPRNDGRYDLVTFWPDSQHPDAHQSYTDPLIDTAMDGTPFDIEVVATSMHEAFQRNAGASPATLMKKIYEAEASMLRDAAERYGTLLEDSLQREREVEADLLSERIEREKAQVEAAMSKADLDRLRQESLRHAPPGTAVKSSNIAVLKKAVEGRRGRDNQLAVLLHMSDGTVRANNWPNGYQARLKYAQSLEGKQVRTDVWGNYPWQEWYQNLYPVEG